MLTRFEKCKRILEKYINDNKRNIICTNDLRMMVIKEIGSDEKRVVFPALNMLRKVGIIREIKANKWLILT